MQKFQNILSLSPNHCDPLHDTKTSTFFSQSFSRCNSEKLIWTLRSYDTKKTCSWDFYKFSSVVHYRKLCKNQVWKQRVTLLFCQCQRSSDTTKIEWKRLFLFTFVKSFFMVFFMQRLAYTMNVWFKFMFGSFFEQNNLLNLIILGVYGKRLLKRARISKQRLM